MKGRRRSDKAVPLKPIVVTLDDGSVVRCSVASIGRESRPRWMLMTSDGVQFIGPEATTDKTPDGVQRLISEWWATRKEPGGA
jgi:hypothetical protein